MSGFCGTTGVLAVAPENGPRDAITQLYERREQLPDGVAVIILWS